MLAMKSILRLKVQVADSGCGANCMGPLSGVRSGFC